MIEYILQTRPDVSKKIQGRYDDLIRQWTDSEQFPRKKKKAVRKELHERLLFYALIKEHNWML